MGVTMFNENNEALTNTYNVLLNESLQIKKETEDTPLLPDLALPAQGLVHDVNNKRSRCDDSEEMNEDMNRECSCIFSPSAGLCTGKSCRDKRSVKHKRHSGFEARFEELVVFKNNFGHCDVPQKHPGLGGWCSTLRSNYKKLQKAQKSSVYLSNARIERLENLGFKWRIYMSIPFDQRTDELITFKDECGYCNVPQEYDANPSLGNWCCMHHCR